MALSPDRTLSFLRRSAGSEERELFDEEPNNRLWLLLLLLLLLNLALLALRLNDLQDFPYS
jgi:hypothetical protein